MVGCGRYWWLLLPNSLKLKSSRLFSNIGPIKKNSNFAACRAELLWGLRRSTTCQTDGSRPAVWSVTTSTGWTGGRPTMKNISRSVKPTSHPMTFFMNEFFSYLLKIFVYPDFLKRVRDILYCRIGSFQNWSFVKFIERLSLKFKVIER